MPPRFVDRIKLQQREWADHAGFKADWFEARSSRRHVLVQPQRTRNLFEPNWWRYIEGKEHRWVAALNSSQCFAVNLFAPLAEDKSLARQVFTRLFSHRRISVTDTVSVSFEYSTRETANWLGERTNGQGTQVDVFFSVLDEASQPIGHVLVEVKLSETEFGSCRGAKPLSPQRSGNPNSERCLNFGGVLAASAEQCWLVETEGRRYWERMADDTSSFAFANVPSDAACPFRHGLYQIMRNRILADAFVDETTAVWADVAVCIHSGNKDARRLNQEVCGEADAVAAFRQITQEDSLLELDPSVVVDVIGSSEACPPIWEEWMRERYFPIGPE